MRLRIVVKVFSANTHWNNAGIQSERGCRKIYRWGQQAGEFRPKMDCCDGKLPNFDTLNSHQFQLLQKGSLQAVRPRHPVPLWLPVLY